MAEVQIASMRISHELILTWLVLNPEKNQSECAKHFGITEAWLSVIINSDVFQARWAERKHFMADQADKMMLARARGVVDKGLERLETLVEASQDPAFVLQTTDKLMGRLGFGPKSSAAPQINITQNQLTVDNETLTLARQAMLQNATAQLPQIDVTPQPEQVEVLDATDSDKSA